MSTPSFKDGVCARFGCKPEDYAATVFWHCLYPHARVPARFLCQTHVFRNDLALITNVAEADSWSVLRRELEIYRYHNPPSGFLRDVLRIRVSTHRLSKLGYEILPPQPHGSIPNQQVAPRAPAVSQPHPA